MMPATIARNEFADRMAKRPMPSSLNSDPEFRLFYDPPEIIQRAFGGREWFWRTGCTRVHRVGLFRGVGWEIDLEHQKQSLLPDVTGVRITAMNRPGKEPTYSMVFVQRDKASDVDPSAPATERILFSKTPVPLDRLKVEYVAVIGEHVL